MGGSPKALTTASGRGNQPAGDDPKSNRGCPDSHNNREIAISAVNFGDVGLSQGPLSSGPVHTGVTVVAAPSGKRSEWCSRGTTRSDVLAGLGEALCRPKVCSHGA